MPDSSGYDWLGDVPLQWDTFLDTPPDEADPSKAQVFVIPVPYDSTTSYKSGARYGPKAILNASKHLEDYDLELDRDISEVGIHTTPELSPNIGSPEAMIEQVRRSVHSVSEKGKLPVLLGGEHTLTVGAVQALAELHPGMSVLYLDAHADMRDSYMGSRWGHASVARRVYEICPLVQVGVRSLSAEEMAFIKEKDLPTFVWSSVPYSPTDLLDLILSGLSPEIYISIDLDVIDPSIMSAVGTPEPGGMTWNEITWLLRAVSEQRRVVGFDLVELSPLEGPEACAYTAAKLAYKLIGYATGR